MTALQQQGQAAKDAAYVLSTAGTARKNAALAAIADTLAQHQSQWLEANAQDVAAAKEAGIRPAMLDRLTLTPERIAGIVEGVRQVAALPDPIGRVDKMETRPNGLIIGRRRVPLGVIAIIFEARPNVTVDAAASLLQDAGALEKSMEILGKRAEYYLAAKVKSSVPIGAVMFSDKFGILVRTPSADGLIERISEEYNG